MFRRLSVLAGAIVLGGSLTTNAFAVPINPLNVRPAAGVTAGELASLQAVIDANFPGQGINAATDQEAAGMWGVPSGISGVTHPVIQFQSGAYANTVTFGVWSGSDTTAITTVQVFDGASGPFTGATLQWLPTNSNQVIISGGAGVNTGVHNGIDRYGFGFYIDSPDNRGSPLFWSADQLNDGGLAQMLAYVGSGNNWLLAWEDLNRAFGADNNFIDLVVTAESLVPVPEPGTIALLGTGLFGLASAARRRLAKKKLAA